MSLYPMVPLGHDAVFDQYNIPFRNCDYRLMVNRNIADSYYQDYGNVQYHYLYTDNDLENDLRGLDNEINSERNKQLKELQAHKDLLDHVGYLASKGNMTNDELYDTQDSIHESLKDGHNEYYKWLDLREFPKSFIGKDVGQKEFVSICTYLRKTFRVWYVSFQGNRVVMMGSDSDGLEKCMAELRSELAYYAAGDWVDKINGTTQRYERFKELLDTEFDNVHLIAEDWGVTEDEAYNLLEECADNDDACERELLLFALSYWKN